jgi:DNA modification methylase
MKTGEGFIGLPLDCLHAGDCLDLLPRINDESIDLVFADPPFNIGYDYDIYDDKRSFENYMSWSKRWITEVCRVLKPNGTFWLAIGDEYAADLKTLAHREIGMHLRNWVIWYYTFGVHCQKKFTRSHAHLFYFVKNKKNFVFNDEAIRVPSARQLIYSDRRANPKGRIPDDTWIPRPEDTWVLRPQDHLGGFSEKDDTWSFSRVCGTFKERTGWHGCQMPESLLERIILTCSNTGDIVLDPFGGSGTTLVVAKKLDRRYIGFELSADYSKKINKRLEATKQPERPKSLFDSIERNGTSDS